MVAGRLDCVVRNYAWGDLHALPELLGEAGDGVPKAELWMGAHPGAPSLLGSRSLDELIAERPSELLGRAVAAQFGQLPFLFKVLAAARPLSIQAHPTLPQAITGFARENEAGIPLDGPERTYRDANHKPELICALTRFEAKCGFRSLDQTRRLLESIPAIELNELRTHLAATGPDHEILASLLRLPGRDAARLTSAVVSAVARLANEGRHEILGPFAADVASVAFMNESFPGDIGVVVALLLNHVTLEPGEALYLAAGNLHAYLSGVGMELMANSDNVVRGGLTAKHIDVDELLTVVDTSPIDVPVQRPVGALHHFDSEAPEFALTRVALAEIDRAIEVGGPAIVVLTSGQARIGGVGAIGQGQPVFVGADEGWLAVDGDGLAWLATVDAGQVRPASL
jgi:mannose-6-phosphate isomerase